MTWEATASVATVPLHLELSRPFVDIEFDRPEATTRTARFWADTGGGGLLFAWPLVLDLGLEAAASFDDEGHRLTPVSPPPARVGLTPLNVTGARAFALVGRRTQAPGVEAEGLLPGHVLMRHHVVFDYPNREFAITPL